MTLFTLLLSFSKEDGLKQEKDAEAGSSKATDFQAQFLEFNQRQQMETKKEKGKEEGKTETKGDDKTDVGQIAALLQGSEALAGRWAMFGMKATALFNIIFITYLSKEFVFDWFV